MADGTDDKPYQSLYRRFRPSTFGEVRGQDHVVLALRNAVRDQRVAHAYLFSGPRGTGKTSTARILAKALNCIDLHDGEPCGVCFSCVEIAKGTSLDVHELDAASNNGVEAMRDLVSRAALGTPGRQKVYIVDEVHMLSTAASNALLKTLEEPPAHVVFVLATTDPQKVLPTIRSRTQHFEFRLLGPETLGELLDQVRRDANLDVPDEALDLAVRRGRGSARDALSVLDQVVASDSVDDDLPQLDEVVEALAERDVGRALVTVADLTSGGFSPQQLTGDLVDHLRQGFLSLVAPELVAVAGTERDALAARASRVGLATLVRSMEVLGKAQVDMRDAPDPRVTLEVALVRLAHPEADDSPEAILARIERLEAAGRSNTGVPTPTAPVTPTAPATPTALTATTAPRPAVVPTGTAPPRAGDAAPPATAQATGRTPSPTGSGEPGPAVSSKPASGSTRKTLGAVRRQATPAPVEERPADPDPVPGDVPKADAPDPSATTSGSPTTTGSGSQPPGPAGTFPTRDQLVQAWGDHIIGRLRPKAKALFQAGRFVGVEGEQAVFGLPNEIHRTRCEDVRGEIEDALSDHFNQPVGLVLTVDAGATIPEHATLDRPDDSSSAPPQAASAMDSPAPPAPAPPSAASPSASPPSASPESPRSSPPEPNRAGDAADSAPTRSTPAGSVRPAGRGRGAGESEVSAGPAGDAGSHQHGAEIEDSDDLSLFEESELGEVAEIDNSAQARVLQAFPGAEEVN